MATVKVESVILIQYTFCQIQQIAPHGPLAVHSPARVRQSWLCKRETGNGKRGGEVTRIEPYSIPANQHVTSGAQEASV